MGSRTVAALIAKHPANRAIDESYIDAVTLETARGSFGGSVASIRILKRRKHKRRVGKHNSAFIYEYLVALDTQKSATVERRLVYSSHTDGSREYAYHILTALGAAGFNATPDHIIVPLQFIPETQTLMYEGIPGTSLFARMKTRIPVSTLSPLLMAGIRWLRKFHEFPVTDALRGAVREQNLIGGYWNHEEVATLLQKHDAHQAEKYNAFVTTFSSLLEKTRGRYKPSLVYGDLHPENVISEEVAPASLTMIDVTDVSWGDPLRDIGTFIQQITVMGRPFYSEKDLGYLRETIIQAYFGKPSPRLEGDELLRINTYQAWTALRSFIYFFFNPAKRKESYGLLEDAWLYLTLAKQRDRSFTINHRAY